MDAADGWASATMPAGNWSSSTGDWIVLRITPMAAPTGLTNGFGAGPVTVDVTARWALAGTAVHQFNRAIGILLRSTEKGLVPATFENGHWRVLSRVPSAGTLPTGWEDGFYTDSAGFHLMTKHLSVFGLLHDLEAPNPPQNVRGFLGPTGGLTLRWTPGSDNSGTYDFVTLFSDATDAGHFGVDYTAASIGGWSVGDQRIFRLKETDLAGNESSLTQPLRPVPSLVGKTPDQAAALLAALGFTIGSTTTGGTGPAGTITGPAGLVLAEAGSAIDVTVSPGSGSTRLVLKVTTAREGQAGRAEEEHRSACLDHPGSPRDRRALQPAPPEAVHLALLAEGRPLDHQAAPPAPGTPHRRLHHALDRALRPRDDLTQDHDQAPRCAQRAGRARPGPARRASGPNDQRDVPVATAEARHGLRHRADVRRCGQPADRRARDRRRRRRIRRLPHPRSAHRVPLDEDRRAHLEARGR